MIVVAANKPWCPPILERELKGVEHRLVATPEELAAALDERPTAAFFVHWRHIVDAQTLDRLPCIGFHMTDLPQGRGGSPLQHLVMQGCKETKLTALRLDAGIDTGPIIDKRPLPLDGKAQEIYERMTALAAVMIRDLADGPFEGTPQGDGDAPLPRRTPAQSALPAEGTSEDIHDFIRMLDADGYPHAFVDHGPWRLLLTDSRITGDEVQATVTFRRRGE